VGDHDSAALANTPRLVVFTSRPRQRFPGTVAYGIPPRRVAHPLSLVKKKPGQAWRIGILHRRQPCHLSSLRPWCGGKQDVEFLATDPAMLHAFHRYPRPQIQPLGQCPRETTIAKGVKKTILVRQFTAVFI
jgi:hypothetical protein